MKRVKRYFDGMLDADSADFAVPNNCYINNENFRFGPNSGGKYARLEAIESTSLMRNKYLGVRVPFKANNDLYIMYSDDVLVINAAQGVIANDTDENPLTLRVVPGVFITGNGTLILAADGSFVYTPNPGFVGVDTIPYTLVNQNGDTDFAVITINVIEMVRGMILMFNGNVMPNGFALCDGTNGTPNLKGRFIVGLDTADTDYDTIGKAGGEKKHVLTIGEMPPHTHTYSRTVAGNVYGDNSTNQEDQQQNTGSTGGVGGSTVAHENRPPYYTLAYIMKL